MTNLQYWFAILFMSHCAAAFLGFVGGGMFRDWEEYEFRADMAEAERKALRPW